MKKVYIEEETGDIFISSGDVAKILALKVQSISRKAKKGSLKPHTITRGQRTFYLFKKDEILAYKERLIAYYEKRLCDLKGVDA